MLEMMSAIVAPRAVAVHHEECVLERDAGLSQTQRRVRRSAEVVRDHDVRRRLLQSERHCMRVHEMPRLHGLDRAGTGGSESGVVVDALPVGSIDSGAVLPEQNLDRVPEPSQRQREERRRGAHATDRVEAAQLVRDHRHTASGRGIVGGSVTSTSSMAPEGRKSQRRVTFVADELLGYAGNGIGTTTTFVSVALARMGHSVEVLFAGPPPNGPVDPEWQSLYEDARSFDPRTRAAAQKRRAASFRACARRRAGLARRSPGRRDRAGPRRSRLHGAPAASARSCIRAHVVRRLLPRDEAVDHRRESARCASCPEPTR